MTSLLLALALSADAALADGTALWLQGSPDPTLTPGMSAATPQRLAPPAAWTEVDDAAVEHLAQELALVGPLKDQLDGELQIMRRLEGALAAVDLVRAQDRDLAWRALVFQGYAVHRYFQDTLATDPAAAPWRQALGGVGGELAVAPWLRAIALDPERVPTAEELPDEPQRVAYTELRARRLLEPGATVQVEGAATLVVDGRPAPARKALLMPGLHQVALVIDGELAVRERVDLAAGETRTLRPLASAARLQALGETLAAAKGPVLLAPEVLARLEGLEAPVALLVEVDGDTRRFDVVGTSAVPLQVERERRGEGGPALVVGASVGGGWVYDGNFVLQNEDAPESVGTANAGAPVGALSLGGEVGAFAFGLGVDLAVPVGAHHDLPVGEGRMRARPFPHVALGHRLIQVAAGPLLPWHLGVGPRLSLPLPDLRSGPLQLVASYTHGINLPLTDEAGADFEPGQARLAWLGVGGRWRSR